MKKTAILLANLGSPSSTSVKDLRTYLGEFLMDEKVIDIPYFARLLLVKGIIVPFRAPKSAAMYKSVWTDKGSPLIQITKELKEAVEEVAETPTYMCMRYANPTPKFAFEQILNDQPDVERVVMVPMYPHYAMSSYETAVEHVQRAHKEGGYNFGLEIVKPYYKHPEYLNALAESMRPYLQEDFDHLLFSYHGIPVRHLKKTDITGSHCMKVEDCCNKASKAHDVCYRHQVIETTHQVAKILGVPEGKYSFSFQSRLGSDKWLTPYTTGVLKEMPAKGIKNLVIACPAFVSDCLETLEEIQEEGREDFMEAGGEKFTAIPCLNTNPDWVKTVHKLAKEAV